jgi:hexosaminidase
VNTARTATLVPLPVSMKTLDAPPFTLAATSRIAVAGDGGDSVAERLAGWLRSLTGFALPVTSEAAQTGDIAVILADGQAPAGHADEGYVLAVDDTSIRIGADTAAGLFWGTQSLRQLVGATGGVWSVPAVDIVDYPRYAYRGVMLDVVRHFFGVEDVKRYLDELAGLKINHLHLHLTDDQGWRIEIRKYPRLTSIGGWRSGTLVGPYTSDTSKQVFDRETHGGFYTQTDIREIVAYARARFVNVVPEIEMPGHAQAAIAAYPWLGNAGDSVAVWGLWGVSQNILNPSDSTIAFMQDVLTEVMELFPGPYIHVGGDEAIKGQWKSTARVQERMRALGLRNEDELQSWFITQMDTFLTAHGRRMIGWDEILEGGLAPNAVVMSWRGTAGGIAAARAGHDVVMAPGSHTYLDHYQALDRTKEPLAIGGFLPLDTVYSYDPLPADLEPRFARHVLGAQGQVWAEYIKGPKNVEYMAYPRMSALAEVLWTPLGRKDYTDFLARLAVHLRRLDALDVNYRKLGGDGG